MAETDYPRRFVKTGEVLDDLTRIEPYFRDLLARDITALADLEQWLLDGSELAACLAELRTDRYVQMTCHTDDEQLAQRYLRFVEEIDPPCRKWWHELNLKYVAAPAASQLPPQRYFVLDRSTRAAVDLFREKNIPLLVDQTRIAQEYQKICGQMTVQFDGEEKTLQQMGVYLENTDRALRQQAWELVSARRLEDREKLEDIYDALRAVRTRLAENADMPDFREYAFRGYERFDYTPQDCLAFHDAIERAVVPAVRAMNARRQALLGVDSLRPWDLSVDPKGRDRLQPFDSVEELCAGCQQIFDRVDPELGRQFADMRKNNYLDLASRKGKAPGGYQSTYEEQRRPFIFMNAVGLHRDVETLLHEGGHSFHAYASRDDDLIGYRSAPIEFAEVASMGMELLAMDHLDVFYAGDDLVRAKRKQLEGILAIFPWVATIDAFQHWVYTHPQHSRDDRKAYWLSLQSRFGGGVDYTGYADAEAYAWHRQLHLFELPFYYVEYAIAQLGALQVWQNARRDRAAAVRQYRAGLAVGGARPLPELFSAAGIRFDFTYDTVAPLIEAVQHELDQLPD
ncbi:MAG TPA: M3 family oligoendopeptidase [Phycisphaerae bacterium]|nr:M3 family oligoendopeptidase [Phycisphaerae bacterium]